MRLFYVRNMAIFSAISIMTVSISGCQDINNMNKQGWGTTIGALSGAAVGSTLGKGSGKYVAIAGGAILGGYIGNKIGGYLDEQDKQKLAVATQKTIKTGKTQRFSNPKTGVKGKTKLIKTTTMAKNKQKCRTVQQQVTLQNGTQKTEEVTACKGADGWAIQA